MIILKISHGDSGGRLDKYLLKFLKEAPASFLFKMLRKKNIVLNGKKAAGNETLSKGDEIKLFLSDDTIRKFGGKVITSSPAEREYKVKEEDLTGAFETEAPVSLKTFTWEKEIPKIIYEDRDLLILNKPTDVLSQGSHSGEASLNDWLIRYLITSGSIEAKDLLTMKPAVTNRLDRNTSGIILAGKTLPGLRFFSEVIKERSLRKEYLTVVKGNFDKEGTHEAYLYKDTKHNTVRVLKEEAEGAAKIITSFKKIAQGEEHSLLLVGLHTGKSHQIRAHLSFLGFPVIGDGKYGKKSDHITYRRMGLKSQFLHSYRITFPKLSGNFSYLSKTSYQAELSPQFLSILKRLEMKDAFMEFERTEGLST